MNVTLRPPLTTAARRPDGAGSVQVQLDPNVVIDRKSTRLNSSHT